MENLLDDKLNRGFDELMFQLSKGITIAQYSKGERWRGFEKVGAWKSRFGYQFQIYSNDHFIDNKPHFHIVNAGVNMDCKFFFDGTLIQCINSNEPMKKIINEIKYFLSVENNRETIINLWNQKNPTLIVK